MKVLIQKERRENLKIAVLGFVVFGLLLLLEYYNYTVFMEHLVRGGTRVGRNLFEPLKDGAFQVETAVLCPILALLLGWFQVFNERHRDLWSFLVHRPMTHTRIFLGKTAAGLGLYFLAAGLPLLLFILWAVTPGHVAAPFEWSLLAPIAASFLAGPSYYFAGMLVAGRQARWYASRGLPLAAGLFLSIGSATVPHFWQALLLLVVGAIILGMAAWGSFETNGFFEGQPPLAKPATSISLALGASLVTASAVAMTSAFLPGWPSFHWSSYGMTPDGTIYIRTQTNGQSQIVTDLNGKPLKDNKTGLPINVDDVNQPVDAPGFFFGVDFGAPPPPSSYFNESSSSTLWREVPGTLWFYWGRYGRLVGFDAASRRFVGSLGPNGFAPDVAGGGARFEHPPAGNFLGGLAQATVNFFPQGLSIFNTRTALYEVDLQKRAVTPIFTTSADDPIGGVGEYFWPNPAERDKPVTAVATKQFIYLLGPDGKVEWKTPYAALYPDYNQVQVYLLSPGGHYALWFLPSHESAAKLPVKVTWFADGQSTKSVELPDVSYRPAGLNPGEKAMALLGSPVVVASLELFSYWWSSEALWLSLAASVVLCVPLGWWFTHRYHLERRVQWGWAAFHVLFGVPGLLAFLSANEWPAREPCPNCKRLRVVTRARCEHCDATFPPPPPAGVEIFELAGAERHQNI